MAQIEATVKSKIPYAIPNCKRVTKRPAFPTKNPEKNNRIKNQCLESLAA